MGPGWGPVPQRPAEIRRINREPGGLAGSICGRSVPTLGGPRFTAEMGQRCEGFCGQAQSSP